jgi:hypothetical protein
MSATIVTVSSSKRLDLSNGQALRRPIYLSNWTTMRIGLRLCFPTAVSIVGTPGLYVGMGSGLTAGIGDATTTNWIGVKTITGTWTRSLSGSQSYGNIGSIRVHKRVGATLTSHASDMTATMHQSFDALFQSVILVEITKGSPNYTVNIGVPTSNSGVIAVNITDANMDAYMSLPIGMAGIGSVSNLNIVAVAVNNTLAMSEAAGVLDCLQIYWDKTAVNCEIESVWHRKLA